MALVCKPCRGLPTNEDHYYKARQYENKVQQNCVSKVKCYNKMTRVAECEEILSQKEDHQLIEQNCECVRVGKEEKLARRRAKLKVLLETEEQLLYDELKTTTMGLVERRRWLEARSRALKKQQKDDKIMKERERETSVSEEDRHEFSVCSIHPQSNADTIMKDVHVVEQKNRACCNNNHDVTTNNSKMAVLQAVEGRKKQLRAFCARKMVEVKDQN